MEAEIEALIDGVIDAAPEARRFDLMERIAVPIPILVIAHILGVDESRLPEFRAWSEGLTLGLDPMRTAEQTAWMEESREELDAYFTELMDARRGAPPRDDLISDQPVFMSLAAANRDPGTFEAPEAFDITVKRRSHVSFGGGAHICIGAPLARIEARRVYRKLFERYPAMQLAEQELVWRTLPFFRGLERLEVEV